MNLRQYMLIFGFGTVVALVAWMLVLINIDPVSTGLPSVVVFLLTLFAAAVGFFTTIGTLVRGIRFKDRDVEDIVKTSLRQGILLGMLIITSVILLRLSSLTWVSVGLMVLLLGCIEFASLSLKNGSKHHQEN